MHKIYKKEKWGVFLIILQILLGTFAFAQQGTVIVNSNPDHGPFDLWSDDSTFAVTTATPYNHLVPRDHSYTLVWKPFAFYPLPDPSTVNFYLPTDSTETIMGFYVPLLPPDPSNLQAQPFSYSKIDLTWQNNGLNVDGFIIEHRLESDTGFTVTGVVANYITYYQDTGLTPDSVYYYQVKATNGAGTSGPSNVAIATTLSLPVSEPIPDFYADITSGFSTMSVQFYDNSQYADSWNWDLGNGANSANQNPTLIYTSSVKTSYTIRLIASNTLGSATAIKVDYLVMGLSPTNLSLSAITSGIYGMQLNWQDNSDNENGFRVYRQNSYISPNFDLLTTLGPNLTSYSDYGSDTTLGLDSTAKFVYRVTAYTSDTESDFTQGFAFVISNFYTFVTSGYFTPLGQATAYFGDLSANATDWQWDFGDGTFGVGQDPGPHVYSSSTSAVYKITLTVSNNLGFSDSFSRFLYLNSPPSNINAMAISNNQVSLSWQNPALYETGSELYREVNQGGFTLYASLSPHTNSYLDSGLSPNTDYSYRVRSTTYQAISDFTNIATAHTSSTSTTVLPLLLDFSLASDTLQFAFESVPNTTGKPTVNWFPTYQGATGILRLLFTDINQGVKITLLTSGWFSTESGHWYLMKVRLKSDTNKPNNLGTVGLLYNGLPPGPTDLNGHGLISVGTTWTYLRNYQESYGGTNLMYPQLSIRNNSDFPIDIYIDSIEIKEIPVPVGY